MKKCISLLLSLVFITSFITVPQSVEAADLISTETLFMTYPTYLSNSEMDEGLAKASEAYYAVINSYSDADETLAAYMTAFSEGVSLLLKEGASKLGWTESMYEQYAREAATKYMQSMLTDENTIKKASKSVETAYKTLKTSYSIGSTIDKAKLEQDLSGIANAYDIGISKADMEELVGDLYDSGSLKKDLDAIGEAMDLWKIVFELTEIHAIEMKTMDLLLDELVASGQTNSDLYLGLTLLKNDINKSPAEYVLKYYATDKALSFLADKVDDLIFSFASGTAVSIVTTCTKVFANYIYVNAKADDIAQAIMQTSFVSSIDICLSQYRLKFLQRKGTTADIETYEQLYGAYLSAIRCTLDSCYDLSKITDKFSLGGDCMVWSDEIKYTYTYDKYIEWCKEEVAHALENATLDTSGNSTITDALNEETIRANFERVYRLYPPNMDKTWNGTYDGAKNSLGFVGKIFNHLFDSTITPRVQNDYQYILTSNRNVRLFGRLEETDVTVNALKELFENARIGDVIITSGQYDDLHAMILTGVTDMGIVVYDCGSEYAENSAYNDIIREYEFGYEKMADAFSKNGDYHQKPGLSVYRAIKKINAANSGSSLTDAEYDDSVNYIIENGVLTSYKGSRTTLKIPDGVTEIGEKCFYLNESIKYVYMPDTVTTINMSAFSNCHNLQYIKLSNNLTDIDGNAFNACESLKNIVLPETLERIGAYAFSHTGLTKVVIPDKVGLVDWYAFGYCENLSEITFGKSLYAIGDDVVWNCYNLKTIYWNVQLSENYTGYTNYENALHCAGSKGSDLTVIIGENVTTIPDKAFGNSYYITEVIMNDKLTSIGNYAFDACNSLKGITFPNTLTKIGDRAFAWCDSLEEIILPENIETIGVDAFLGTKALKCIYWNAKNVKLTDTWDSPFYDTALEHVNATVLFGDTVDVIPEHAFFNCDWVTEIKINENVKQIEYTAFFNCGITSIYIPDTTELAWGAFGCCSKLKELTLPANVIGYPDELYGLDSLENIYASANNTEFVSVNGVLYRNYNNELLLNFVPAQKSTITLPQNCIGYNSWGDATNLENILVENGNNVFTSEDGNLYHISKTSLLKYACGKRNTTFEVPNFVTTICSSAFDNARYLTEIKLHDGIVEIQDMAFNGCKNLTKINLPENITSIGRALFQNCKNLNSLTIPDSVEAIEDWAFNSCTSLEDIILPDGLTDIGEYAFQACTSLQSVTIPRSIKNINNNAFYRCDGLTDIYYNGPKAEWDTITIGNGNEALLNATVHFNPAKIGISNFNVNISNALATINISAANIPSTAVIYVAAYDSNDVLCQLQPVTLSNGSAQVIMNGGVTYTAFVWDMSTLKPLCTSATR